MCEINLIKAFLLSKGFNLSNGFSISRGEFTNCINVECVSESESVYVKFEIQNSESEVNKNLEGYANMPSEIKPKIFEQGYWNKRKKFLIMENAGISFADAIKHNNDNYLNVFKNKMTDIYLNYSSRNKSKVEEYLYDLLGGNGFNFIYMLDIIDLNKAVNTHGFRLLIKEFQQKIKILSMPESINWSPQDFTINHIRFKNNHIKFIDPKEKSEGLLEFDLGRLYCMLEMFTPTWKQSLPKNCILFSNNEIQKPQNLLMIMAKDIRKNINGSEYPIFFELGKVWQYVIATRTRSGSLIKTSFNYAEEKMHDIICNL